MLCPIFVDILYIISISALGVGERPKYLSLPSLDWAGNIFNATSTSNWVFGWSYLLLMPFSSINKPPRMICHTGLLIFTVSYQRLCLGLWGLLCNCDKPSVLDWSSPSLMLQHLDVWMAFVTDTVVSDRYLRVAVNQVSVSAYETAWNMACFLQDSVDMWFSGLKVINV